MRMKLAAIYNIFDGEELLEGSIKQVYDLCAEVIIVWQDKSNYGQLQHTLGMHLLALQERWPNVRLVRYYPDLSQHPAYNERRKRAMGLDRARELGCTHFLFMDNDEYYVKADFEKAMHRIDNDGYDATACRLYTYFKTPHHRLVPMEQYWVPFICAIKRVQRVGDGFPVYADPTRGVLPVEHFYPFPKEEMVMHHYSYVRKDMRLKLENSIARRNFGDIDSLLQRIETWQPPLAPPLYHGHTVEEVENLFGINQFIPK